MPNPKTEAHINTINAARKSLATISSEILSLKADIDILERLILDKDNLLDKKNGFVQKLLDERKYDRTRTADDA
jgi:hypothetical protein